MTAKKTNNNKAYFPFDLEKYRWSVRNNLLSGITLFQLCRVLYRHRHAIAWRRYPHRLVFLFLMSIPTTIISLFEYALYHRRIKSQTLHPVPIFILGHPRTGTTLLHNLFSQDPNLAYCDTFQAGFASSFLTVERKLPWLKYLLSTLIDPTRPMDNMPLSFDTPAEDEIAINMMTSGISPYMCITVMSDYRKSLRFATFDEQSTSDDERQAWIDAFLFFMKKVTYARCLRGGGLKPLVIKSPVHIGRIQILRELFPQAKFVFVHRNPIDTFLSSAILAQEYFNYCYLDAPTPQQITDYILEQHAMLYEMYFKARPALNAVPHQLSEVSFAELEQDPVATMKRVYTDLGLEEWFDQGIVERYARRDLDGFKKNRHSVVSDELMVRLQEEVGDVMNELQYRT